MGGDETKSYTKDTVFAGRGGTAQEQRPLACYDIVELQEGTQELHRVQN